MKSEDRNFRVIVDQVNITNLDRDVYEKFDCEVYHVNNRTYMTSSHTFTRTVDEISVHAALDFYKLNSKQKMKLYDVEFDGCYILEHANKNRLFNMYVQKGRRFRGSERFIQASMYIFHIFSLFFNEKNLITRALI